MIRQRQNPKEICHFLQYRAARHLHWMLVLPLIATYLLSPLARGARPGGVPVLLPPFIPVPAPQPYLQAVSPFNVIGFMQSATLDATCVAHPFCGGTVVVNGITITVPTNTIFQMPATSMTWEELFTNAPTVYRPLQSGLALSDIPRPLTTYEINVFGNRVNFGGSDRYIAGLIFMSNQSVNGSVGYINFIDYSKGEIWVSQTLTAGPAGARLRINTPKGRYGNPDPNADPRFGADEDNPTIAARTGYPMCLPRFDPKSNIDSLCPQWNRPVDPYTGAFATNFTMSPAPAGVAVAPPAGDGLTHQLGYPTPAIKPDPFEQVPFEIGDFIFYNGTLTADPNGGQYISTHTVSADIGVFTAPGTWPVYVSIGEFRIGVGGTPNPLFPQEALEKIFGDAFTTDPSALVDIYAVDVDPCMGTRTHRFYMTSNPFGPPLGGLKGRARFRTTIGNFLPPTREMAASSRTLTGNGPLDALTSIKLTANGLTAGVFQAPQFNFLFPENLVIGSPQIPLPFQEFPFLVNGFGPYVPFNASSTAPPVGVIGQLSPWPSVTPPASTCTTGLTLLQPPVANAGPPQTVASGSKVSLDGTGSSDPNIPAMPLIYTWVQSDGPAVALQDPSLSKPSFTAPIVPTGTAPVTLTFQLATCNGYTCGGVSSVTVTVTPAPPVLPLSVLLSALPATGVTQGTAVTLTAAPTGGSGALKYTFTQTAGPNQSLTQSGANSGTATFTANVLPVAANLVFKVTVTDSAVPAPNTATSTVTVYVVGAPAIPIPITLTAAPGTGVHQGSSVALTATATGGSGKLTYTFTQTAGPAQTLTQNTTLATFAVSLPTPVVATALTFKVTVTDSVAPTPNTGTASVTVNVAGADTLTATPVTYVLSKSKLQVVATSTASPNGAAVLTMTPLGVGVFITAASNASPVVLTAFGHGFALGTTPTITISGATGSWTPLNGTFIVKVIDSSTFSVPVNSKLFGPLTGSVTYMQSFGPDVVLTFDSSLDTYNVLADIVQPGPNSVRIRSSYGGSIIAPVTRTR